MTRCINQEIVVITGFACKTMASAKIGRFQEQLLLQTRFVKVLGMENGITERILFPLRLCRSGKLITLAYNSEAFMGTWDWLLCNDVRPKGIIVVLSSFKHLFGGKLAWVRSDQLFLYLLLVLIRYHCYQTIFFFSNILCHTVIARRAIPLPLIRKYLYCTDDVVRESWWLVTTSRLMWLLPHSPTAIKTNLVVGLSLLTILNCLSLASIDASLRLWWINYCTRKKLNGLNKRFAG